MSSVTPCLIIGKDFALRPLQICPDFPQIVPVLLAQTLLCHGKYVRVQPDGSVSKYTHARTLRVKIPSEARRYVTLALPRKLDFPSDVINVLMRDLRQKVNGAHCVQIVSLLMVRGSTRKLSVISTRTYITIGAFQFQHF